MADGLYELLAPYLSSSASISTSTPPPLQTVQNDASILTYLNRLLTLPLSSLSDSEPTSLAQSQHSTLLSLRALSSRSHKAIIASSDHLASLKDTLPAIATDISKLSTSIPKLEDAVNEFGEKYSKAAQNEGRNAILERRRKALLLSRNADRLSDILELPTLLSSAINSSTSTSQNLATPRASDGAAAGGQNYASALDLNAHIRRLHILHPSSPLISIISHQAETEMAAMTSSLISSLRGQNLKLASAMRTISWLRRIAPELEGKVQEKGHGGVGGGKEGSLGALFLVCRLANLLSMLAALEPLRELADQEALGNNNGNGNGGRGWMGQQTERYLKRYIEIFREQSFAIISVFRSIFPAESAIDVKILPSGVGGENTSDPLQPLPSSLGSFPLRLVDMLLEVLRVYLPNVRDRSARDSLLTQVLYCAGSLGRLGGDFSLVLAFLEEARDEGEGEEMDEEEEEEEEWVAVVKRHRVLAGRLESMVGAH